ncbi:MAG TPA: hypothetical protein VFF79_12590 [Conexibacter sp.]|jgi:hypothetical protein|nr:hypothetical protein [Conexibacter sp.]
MSQHLDALAVGQARRIEIARIRGEVRRDPYRVRDLLLDPPPALTNLTVLDVLRMPLKHGTATPVLSRIGRRAAAARISLLEPMGSPSSRRAREWAVEHGLWHVCRRLPGAVRRTA